MGCEAMKLGPKEGRSNAQAKRPGLQEQVERSSRIIGHKENEAASR